MTDNTNVCSSVPTALGEEMTRSRFRDVLHQSVPCIDDGPSCLNQPQTDFHVLSMVPCRIKTANVHERCSMEHGTWAVGEAGSSWTGTVFCRNFNRTEPADQIIGLFKHRSASDSDHAFLFINRRNLGHHVGNPIGFRANVNIGDGHPFSSGVFNRPLATC